MNASAGETIRKGCIGILVAMLSQTLAAAPSPADGDRTLIAVFPREFPPIYTVTENGLPSGFGIEFVEEVAKHAHLRIEYRPVENWVEAMTQLAEGKADLIPNEGITEARGKLFEFTVPIESVPLSLFVRGERRDLTGLDDFAGRRVGVVRSNYGVTLMEQHPEIRTRTFRSLGDLFEALIDGRIDGAVYPTPIFQTYAKRRGAHEQIRTVGAPLAVLQRAIAVHRDDAALVDRLNEAIGQVLASPGYPDLYRRWHPVPVPFWNTQRVLLALLSMLALAVIAWYLHRVRLLRRMNRKLTGLNTFNRAVLAAALEGIVTVDADGHICSVNATGEQIFRETEQALLGRPFTDLVSGSEGEALAESFSKYRSATEEHRHWDVRHLWEISIKRADGELVPVRVGIAPMDVEGELNFVCTLHDESRARQAELRAEHLTTHDPLTGLLNQTGAQLVLDAVIRHDRPARLACICAGLVRLGHINGVYGRRFGDEMLMKVAMCLRHVTGIEDPGRQIARVGGGRFLVILPGVGIDGARATARALAEDLGHVQVSGGEGGATVHPDAQIGVACYPEHGASANELMYHADVALARAHENPAESPHVFDATERAEQSVFEHTLQSVRSAINDNRLELHYQPIRHIASGRVTHYEALLRMRDAAGEVIMPAQVIPVAERFGLIGRIDYRVLQLVLGRLEELRPTHPDIAVAVNWSAVHLRDAQLLDRLKADLAAHRHVAANVIIEITETAALQNFTYARDFMEDLKALGCRFALDDFGVGFTSFAQLRTLPVDLVKIDGMFVRDLCRNTEDQTLVRALTDVTHSLGKKVVAEFVEDRAIYELLRQYGVDYAQGYHIGRPGPDLALDHTVSPRPLRSS